VTYWERGKSCLGGLFGGWERITASGKSAPGTKFPGGRDPGGGGGAGDPWSPRTHGVGFDKFSGRAQGGGGRPTQKTCSNVIALLSGMCQVPGAGEGGRSEVEKEDQKGRDRGA